MGEVDQIFRQAGGAEGLAEGRLVAAADLDAPAETLAQSPLDTDALVGAGARVDRAILDKHVLVGAGAVVGHGPAPRDPGLAWLDGLVLVGKDAQVPEGMRIGRGVVVGINADFSGCGAAIAAGGSLPSRLWYEGLV